MTQACDSQIQSAESNDSPDAGSNQQSSDAGSQPVENNGSPDTGLQGNTSDVLTPSPPKSKPMAPHAATPRLG
ncbi:unnamed protein product [Rodentolepis nana]|uniref:B-cell CLL/lymphoma 7 protein family member A n=1 Tax=Rodentolepis nana TaxID=102285 RepID=A0A0R3T486_RODNA|nr:unnamed protein product [Rodentolepis nana]